MKTKRVVIAKPLRLSAGIPLIFFWMILPSLLTTPSVQAAQRQTVQSISVCHNRSWTARKLPVGPQIKVLFVRLNEYVPNRRCRESG